MAWLQRLRAAWREWLQSWRDRVPPLALWPALVRYLLTHRNYQSGKGDKDDS